MSLVWQLSGHRNALKIEAELKARLCFWRGQLRAHEWHPRRCISPASLLSRWMKRSRRIPFPSSEPGKWRRLFAVRGQRERWMEPLHVICGAAGTGEGSALGTGRRTDHPSIGLRVCPQPLDSAESCKSVCLITQHGNGLNRKGVNSELGFCTVCVHMDARCLYVCRFPVRLPPLTRTWTHRRLSELVPSVWWHEMKRREEKRMQKRLQIHHVELWGRNSSKHCFGHI